MDNPNEVYTSEDVAERLESGGVMRVNTGRQARKFSDVMDEIAPQGERAKLKEFEGQEIVFLSLRFFAGRFGDACFCIFTDANGEMFNMILNQKIILPKLSAVRDELPVKATVVKKEGTNGRSYWDIE